MDLPEPVTPDSANAPLLTKGSNGVTPPTNEAADLIRQKITGLYANEPNAEEEQDEAEHVRHRRSKHQQFMHELTTSGKSLAEIQTGWHNYYIALSDDQKHQVWQEFYREHDKASAYAKHQHDQAPPTPQPPVAVPEPLVPPRPKRARAENDARSVVDLKQQLLGRIQARSKVVSNPHVRSLIFGLSMGSLVVVALLFSFFNERFLAPLITPSRSVSNTPIIIDPATTAVGSESLVIIPKINVEIPVVYDEPSIDERSMQAALERGTVHYATTSNPGEVGNTVVFGHSSNNILNKGKYKFAFVLLNRLQTGDTFMLQKDGKRYVYRVFDRKVVKPTDIGVLQPISDRAATATLITCDPPGTSLNRLVVSGEQITPDPAANVASSVSPTIATTPANLPSNSPSLWHRITSWLNS
jgi:sortase A